MFSLPDLSSRYCVYLAPTTTTKALDNFPGSQLKQGESQ